MRRLRAPLVLLALLTGLTGLVYPLAVTAVARLLLPAQAGGSLLGTAGTPHGSALIGQPFTGPEWFWGRPSATERVPYDAAASAGSNLGPSSEALLTAVRERLDALRGAGPVPDDPVPVDLVTASASGLDPHVSPAAARWQVPRVAQARGLPPERVRALVDAHVEPPQLGVFGEPRVNVLALNLALAALAGR